MPQTSITHSPSFYVLIHSYLSLLSLSLSNWHCIPTLYSSFFLLPSFLPSLLYPWGTNTAFHKTVFITRHIITFTLISFIAAFFYFFRTFDHFFSFIYSIWTFPQHQTKKRLSLLVLSSVSLFPPLLNVSFWWAFPKIIPGNSHLQVNLTRELVRFISYLTQNSYSHLLFPILPTARSELIFFFW